MLKAITAVELREKFKKVCDDVMAGATVIVSRPRGNNVVLLSENAYIPVRARNSALESYNLCARSRL